MTTIMWCTCSFLAGVIVGGMLVLGFAEWITERDNPMDGKGDRDENQIVGE